MNALIILVVLCVGAWFGIRLLQKFYYKTPVLDNTYTKKSPKRLRKQSSFMTTVGRPLQLFSIINMLVGIAIAWMLLPGATFFSGGGILTIPVIATFFFKPTIIFLQGILVYDYVRNSKYQQAKKQRYQRRTVISYLSVVVLLIGISFVLPMSDGGYFIEFFKDWGVADYFELLLALASANIVLQSVFALMYVKKVN